MAKLGHIPTWTTKKSSSHNKSQICPHLFGLIYNRGFSAKKILFFFLLTSLPFSKGIENEQYNTYRYGKWTLFKRIIVYFPKNVTFSKSRYLPLKPKTQQRTAMPLWRQCPARLYILRMALNHYKIKPKVSIGFRLQPGLEKWQFSVNKNQEGPFIK